MTRGYTVDVGPGSWAGADYLSRWAPGILTKSFIRIWAPRNSIPTATFRCSSCGYLESYAGPEFGSKRQFSLKALFLAFTLVAVVLGFLVTIARLVD